MNKRFWLPLTALVVVFLLFFLGPKTYAWMQFRSGNNATVARGQTVDSTLWVGGRNVDIAGTINGDVFCGAQTVNISGTINGDVICAAQTINISGTVEGNVRLAAQTINLTGNVGHNATIAGQTINTDSRSRIGTDASLAGSELNLNGGIGRDLSAAGSNVNLSGSVGRDIKSSAKQITLASGATVGGGIDYTSKNKIYLAGGSQVGGMLTQHQPKARENHFARLAVFSGVAALFMVLMLVVSALIITALLPQLVHRVSNQGMQRPWTALGVGLLASILVPIVGILLVITVVGIPVAILLFLSWLLINLSSGLFSAYYVGRRVWQSQHNPLLIVLAGGLILVILFLIPIIGIIALVLTVWLGEGMILLTIKNAKPTAKYQVK